MSMHARAVVIPGDDIDTDVLYPGTYLNVTDVEQMTHHLFEGLDPGLRDRLGGDTALVVGSNFGCGSSREHVPQAMRASGIPVTGFTWFSLTDQIDWQHALRVERNDLHAIGLYDLDRKIRPVGRRYKEIVRQWRDVLAEDAPSAAASALVPGR